MFKYTGSRNRNGDEKHISIVCHQFLLSSFTWILHLKKVASNCVPIMCSKIWISSLPTETLRIIATKAEEKVRKLCSKKKSSSCQLFTANCATNITTLCKNKKMHACYNKRFCYRHVAFGTKIVIKWCATAYLLSF